MKLNKLLIFLLLLSPLVKGQLCVKADCDKVRDYSNAKITNEYLLVLASKEGVDKTNYEKIKETFKSNTIEAPVSYQQLKPLLEENGFKATLTNVSEKIFNIKNFNLKDSSAGYDSRLFVARIDSVLPPKIKSQIPTYSSVKSSLQKEIEAFFSNFIIPSKKAIPNRSSDTSGIDAGDYQQQSNLTDDNNSFFSFSNFNFWSLIILALLLATFFFFLHLNKRLSRHRKEIEELKKRPSYPMVSNQTPVTDIKKQVEMLVSNHSGWEGIRYEINGVIKRLEKLENSNTDISVASTSLVRKEVKREQEIFYMSFPVNNYFPITAKSSTKDNTVYKFTVKANKTEAEFEVHTGGAPVGELLSMLETYIKPACDEENLPIFKVTNIITSKPGFSVLEGDKWVIKQKALIRYE